MLVGLTGGIGSGKSTVAGLLGGHGAVVIDADQVAREVVESGTPGFDAVVERFGPSVVGPDGSLDRAAIAAVVFEDPSARLDLNAIVHPLVAVRSAERIAEAPPGAIVVYDVPLLAENNMAAGFEAVIVVEASLPVRLARLADRGLPEDEARARIAAQATDEQRRAIADFVIPNDGTLAELASAVDVVWEQLVERGGLEPREGIK